MITSRKISIEQFLELDKELIYFHTLPSHVRADYEHKILSYRDVPWYVNIWRWILFKYLGIDYDPSTGRREKWVVKSVHESEELPPIFYITYSEKSKLCMFNPNTEINGSGNAH